MLLVCSGKVTHHDFLELGLSVDELLLGIGQALGVFGGLRVLTLLFHVKRHHPLVQHFALLSQNQGTFLFGLLGVLASGQVKCQVLLKK